MPIEYQDIYVDLKKLLVPYDRVPESVRRKPASQYDVAPTEVSVYSVKFVYKPGNWDTLQVEAWNFVRAALQVRIAELSKDGWRLTKALDRNMMRYDSGDNFNLALFLIFISPLTAMVSALVGLYMVGPGRRDWLRYKAAVLPMSRLVATLDEISSEARPQLPEQGASLQAIAPKPEQRKHYEGL